MELEPMTVAECVVKVVFVDLLDRVHSLKGEGERAVRASAGDEPSFPAPGNDRHASRGAHPHGGTASRP